MQTLPALNVGCPMLLSPLDTLSQKIEEEYDACKNASKTLREIQEVTTQDCARYEQMQETMETAPVDSKVLEVFEKQVNNYKLLQAALMQFTHAHTRIWSILQQIPTVCKEELTSWNPIQCILKKTLKIFETVLKHIEAPFFSPAQKTNITELLERAKHILFPFPQESPTTNTLCALSETMDTYSQQIQETTPLIESATQHKNLYRLSQLFTQVQSCLNVTDPKARSMQNTSIIFYQCLTSCNQKLNAVQNPLADFQHKIQTFKQTPVVLDSTLLAFKETCTAYEKALRAFEETFNAFQVHYQLLKIASLTMQQKLDIFEQALTTFSQMLLSNEALSNLFSPLSKGAESLFLLYSQDHDAIQDLSDEEITAIFSQWSTLVKGHRTIFEQVEQAKTSTPMALIQATADMQQLPMPLEKTAEHLTHTFSTECRLAAFLYFIMDPKCEIPALSYED